MALASKLSVNCSLCEFVRQIGFDGPDDDEDVATATMAMALQFPMKLIGEHMVHCDHLTRLIILSVCVCLCISCLISIYLQSYTFISR